MPFAYVAHLRTFILLWLMQLAPFFCTHCGWATILAMAPVTFLFLGLDSISGEIENPFGYDWNDLPLDGIIAQLMSDLAQVNFWLRLSCARDHHGLVCRFADSFCFPESIHILQWVSCDTVRSLNDSLAIDYKTAEPGPVCGLVSCQEDMANVQGTHCRCTLLCGST